MALANILTTDRADVFEVRDTRASAPKLVLIYLIALFIPMEFQLGPLAMTPLRIYLLVLTPVLFVNLFTGRYGPLRVTDFLFCLYLVWVTISLTVNNPEMVIQNAGSTTMEYLGGYLVARAAIRDRTSFGGFCKLLGVVIGLTIIPVLWEQVTGDAIMLKIIDSIPGVKSIAASPAEKRMNLYRVQVAFPHAILYGLVCSTGISLTYVALKGELSNTGRLLRTGLVSLCTFFSLSSGALLAIILHIFMIAWSRVFRNIRARWLILFVLIVMAYFVIDLLSNRTPMRVFLTYATFSATTAYTRLYIFEWGMVNVWANPLFGLGFRDWIRPEYMGDSVDNFWLLTAMRFGIPAFLFLSIGFFLLIWTVGRRSFEGDAQMLRYRQGWVFTMVGLCFTLTTVHVWSGAYSFMAFLLGAGVWFLNERPRPDATSSALNVPASATSAQISKAAYARHWLSDSANAPVQKRSEKYPYARKAISADADNIKLGKDSDLPKG